MKKKPKKPTAKQRKHAELTDAMAHATHHHICDALGEPVATAIAKWIEHGFDPTLECAAAISATLIAMGLHMRKSFMHDHKALHKLSEFWEGAGLEHLEDRSNAVHRAFMKALRKEQRERKKHMKNAPDAKIIPLFPKNSRTGE